MRRPHSLVSKMTPEQKCLVGGFFYDHYLPRSKNVAVTANFGKLLLRPNVNYWRETAQWCHYCCRQTSLPLKSFQVRKLLGLHYLPATPVVSGLFVATFVVSVRLYALNINKPNLDASRKRTERAKRANKSIIFTEINRKLD